MAQQDFIKAGFTVVGTETNENKLLSFLKENYPNVIRDSEINIEELKAALGLHIDEKVNGYGLNFVGRNFARAKYAQKTEKELRLNTSLSKNIDTTENLVLKGDNLDTLKILKNHYSGQIKCIYIDPPYNTEKDEFVYPDKFDKEEAEVLGLANLSESDFARMDFSFKTKKSHNGWLAFMYPRLLLARDLLIKDGVIFISIDDNEQANLRVLCDEIFGEENYLGTIIWKNATDNNPTQIATEHEYVLSYAKQKHSLEAEWKSKLSDIKDLLIEKGTELTSNFKDLEVLKSEYNKWYRAHKNELWPLDRYKYIDSEGIYTGSQSVHNPGKEGYRYDVIHPVTKKACKQPLMGYRFPGTTMDDLLKQGKILFGEDESKIIELKLYAKEYSEKLSSVIELDGRIGSYDLKELFPSEKTLFTNPKPVKFISQFISYVLTNNGDIILDFFAGSGTTGDAVMQLNAQDGGKRKFVLCQGDDPIKKDKPAHKFCIDNNLAPVISSITIERLKRAGEQIAKDIESVNSKSGMFEEHKKQLPDIGFKVFDSIDAPKLKVNEMGQISITENETDALSRIYNMIFTIGLDSPTQTPEEVVKDCIYKIGNHYYITNSEKISSDDYSNAIKNGKVFIDGWTASLNGTLQNYKEDVKIVF
ncbi:MAG: site-specific DNA-methyltransferase [Bacteroidetes bacterium]|nr:site-specific DNA-methyltransferase [Bacteroidota bacterium]